VSKGNGTGRIRTITDTAADIKIDPEPLVSPDDEPRPYPLDALSPTIRAAVSAYQYFGQQPIPLVAGSALSVAALATQGLVNVGRDRNLIGPISLNVAVIAESGERKTSADRRMARAARRWQQDFRTSHGNEAAEAASRVAAWQAEREGLLAKIKAAAGGRISKDGLSLEGLKQALTMLEMNRPREPVMPTLFYEDVSPEALGEQLSKGWPSASVWSDEAALVIGSRGMVSNDSALRYFGLLNRFWDGLGFERFRTTAKSFTITGRRLTCSLMMQYAVLWQLLGAAGGVARGTGFLARFLLAWPASTMGARDYRAGNLDAPELATWDARVTSVLSQPLPNTPKEIALDPPTLFLSHEARARWVAFHNAAERELGRLGEFSDVADFAAKVAENAARIAGVMWVFEHGPAGTIDAATMDAAAAIASWHLYEARRLTGATKTPRTVTDAMILVAWMQKPDASGKPRGSIAPRDILRQGPSRLRDRIRRDAAVKLLLESKQLLEVQSTTGTILRLNPRLMEVSHGIRP